MLPLIIEPPLSTRVVRRSAMFILPGQSPQLARRLQAGDH